MTAPRQPIRIGNWNVYPDLNRLTCDGRTISVEGKVMDVLLALAAESGSVVSKNELLDTVWRNQVVADGVLTRAIHELRLALQDDAAAPRYVETVPRRGYRLPMQPETLQEVERRAGRNRLAVFIAGATVAVVGLFVLMLAGRSPEPSSPIRTVAVLPFANLTGDAGNDYVGDGLAEAVIHTIAQYPDIGVTARTSSFAFRNDNMTAEAIGQRLGVDRIFEGSVREQGDVQRLTLQLINVETGLHDASETIDLSTDDLFDSQQRISRAITTMLVNAGAKIDAGVRTVDTMTNARAYDLYLKGRTALHNRSADSLRLARSLFEAAIELDAGFADAYAGLAQLYIVSRTYLQLDPNRSRALARAASNEALALDPDNVDALTAAATVAFDSGDFERALDTFDKAIALAPSDAQARQWYGEALLTLGYLEEGRRSIERALQLNPLAGSTNSVRAKAAGFFTDDDQLAVTARQGQALGALLASRELSLYFFRAGDVDAFQRHLRDYHRVVGVDDSAAAIIASALRGEIDSIALVERLAPIGEPLDNFFARELAMLGLYREALDNMIRGSASTGAFASDVWLPEFRAARSLPEFHDLVESLGYADHWRRYSAPDVCRAPAPESFCDAVLASSMP